MKLKIICILFILSNLLFAIEIKDKERTIQLDKTKLDNYKQIELSTLRNKDGKEKRDNWQGVQLQIILNEFDISDFDQLCFISADNYLVRVAKNDIMNKDCILAITRNEKALNEEHIRLVIPDLRDMFWIQDISSIKTEFISNMAFPHTIYFVEPVLQKTPIRNELLPFVTMTGYTFTEIMSEIFPFLKDEVLLVGKDGVKHSLDYEKYLTSAVLIINENSFDLKSPDMPAGMWIKDLAYVQIFDVAVIFKNHFSSLSEVNDTLKWNSFPTEVIVHYSDISMKQNSNVSFDTGSWNKAEWLEW